MIEWRVVDGWPGYQVSNTGFIKGHKGKVLKNRKNKKGYCRVALCKNRDRLDMSQNQLHAYRLGLKKKNIGSKHGNSKLTESDVLSIRVERNKGRTLTAIAKDFSISKSMVGYIVSNQNWTHI